MSDDADPDQPADQPDESGPLAPAGPREPRPWWRRVRRGRHRRPMVWHPWLLAAFPVLALFAENIREGLTWNDIARPLAMILGAATVLMLVLTILLRSAPRAGLIVSLLAVLFFAFGPVLGAVEGLRVGSVTIGTRAALLGLWAALLLAGVFLTIRTSVRLRGLTRTLNVVAAIMVASNLITVGAYKLQNPGGQGVQPLLGSIQLGLPAAGDAGGGHGQSVRSDQRPDIYYIVVEEYGSSRVLADDFDYNETGFTDFLGNQGFYVADSSTANYPRTSLSVASSLNMRYLDVLTHEYGGATDNTAPLTDMTQDHRVGRFLKSQGYRYIHIGSWYRPTSTSPLADSVISYPGLSEFSRALFQTSLLGSLGGLSGKYDFRDEEWGRLQFQFQALEETAKVPGPKFVFAHIMLLHEPYVMNRNGAFLTDEEEASRTREQNYVEQLRWANTRLEQLVLSLSSGPRSEWPAVVIQSDEGPYEGSPPAWSHSPDPDTIERKFGILNAYRLPGLRRALYPTITPVNTFRLILRGYFGADLPPLPDLNYAFQDLDHLYSFSDVTAAVDASRGRPDT